MRIDMHLASSGGPTVLCVGLLIGIVTMASASESSAFDPLEEIRVMLAEGGYATAENAARELLADVEAESGARTIETARVLDLLAEALWRGGKAGEDEAQAVARRAIDIKKSIVGVAGLDVALSVRNLGSALRVRGRLADAETAFEEALSIQEASAPVDSLELARTLNALGLVNFQSDDLSVARACYLRALAIYDALPGLEPLRAASVLGNLSMLTWRTDELDAAHAYLERAIQLNTLYGPPDSPILAANYSSLGILRYTTGDYSGARSAYEEALRIRERTLPPTHPKLATVMSNLAVLYSEMGNLEDARLLLERAVAISEAHAPESVWLGRRLSKLGSLLLAQREYDSGLAYLERALTILEADPDANQLEIASIVAARAMAHRELGRVHGVREDMERALRLREGVLGDGHPKVAETHLELARHHAHFGELEDCERHIARAQEIFERSLGPEHPVLSEVLRERSLNSLATGDWRTAARLALRSEEIFRAHFRLTSRSLPEREALTYAAYREAGLDIAISIALDQRDRRVIQDAWDALIKARALVLDEMAARNRRVWLAGDAETRELAARTAASRKRLADLVVRGIGDAEPAEYRTALDAARHEKESLEEALAARSASFRHELTRERTGLSEVMQTLEPRAALIAFAHVSDRGLRDGSPVYVAFVLSDGGRVSLVPIGDAALVDAAISTWRKEATFGSAPGHDGDDVRRYTRAGRELAELIWDPLASLLENASRVFVVPAGPLHLVSFSSLPLEDAHFLLETGPTLHHLSAERDLVQPPRNASTGALLALGGPSFDSPAPFAGSGDPTRLGIADGATAHVGPATPVGPASAAATWTGDPPHASPGSAPRNRGRRSACGDFRALRFEDLPAAVEEAREVAELWRRAALPEPYLRIGREASEAHFKESAPGYRVLHLATHGFFLGEQCRSAPSRRGIGGVARATQGPGADAGENPLLLSGLALAGANLRAEATPADEDGILTAEEIASLDLTAVDLAVLSACDTGLGTITTGEGVLGLRRAFETAGVGTIVMSLWAVEDESARAWMRAFYQKRFVEALPIDDAARGASLDVLVARRASGSSAHPFFWAGFVVAGDWR